MLVVVNAGESSCLCPAAAEGLCSQVGSGTVRRDRMGAGEAAHWLGTGRQGPCWVRLGIDEHWLQGPSRNQSCKSDTELTALMVGPNRVLGGLYLMGEPCSG